MEIAELLISENLKKDYTSNNWPPDRIKNLSTLNVFIGPNNSGKSRFIRSLFAEEKLNYVPKTSKFEQLNETIKKLEIIVDEKIKDDENFKWFNSNFEKFRSPYFQERGHSQEGLEEAKSILKSIITHRDFSTLRNELREIRTLTESSQGLLSNLDKPVKNLQYKKIYIPALRSLRPPGKDINIFRERTFNDYFKGNSRLTVQDNNALKNLNELEIITGLELYEQVKKHLLGSLGQRETIAEYEEFLSNRFFKRKKVALIPREGSDVLYVKIGNEAEQPIYKLGDGIQHLIILTIPMFIHRSNKLLLFIEEPELYLHPGFQRLFIETAVEKSDDINRQLFVATHSSQFLDLTLDEKHISVYKLKKHINEEDQDKKSALPVFSFENTSNDDFSILEELGIRNSSILLANCTIWVEGITDRIYLRKFLEVYQSNEEKKYFEDIHYSFIEYGGANIVHWSFLERESEQIFAPRISNKVFLIRDRDGGKITPSHTSLEKSLGANYHRLTSREIENTLSPEVITKVIHEYIGENTSIRDFNKTDYKDGYLGNFIDNSLLSNHDTRKFSATSGTLKDKVTFARKAVDHINSIEDMSQEAINLTEKIYGFIERSNT